MKSNLYQIKFSSKIFQTCSYFFLKMKNKYFLNFNKKIHNHDNVNFQETQQAVLIKIYLLQKGLGKFVEIKINCLILNSRLYFCSGIILARIFKIK